jgi:hypothetical protein
MHRAIAAWLTERPWRAAVASVICGVLAPPIQLPFLILAGAIPVLIALHSDAKFGFVLAAIGAAAAMWVVSSVTPPQSWTAVAVGTALLIAGPVLLAGLLERTGSMNLCFQVAVLSAAAVLIAVHVVLDDPIAVWVEPLRTVFDSMASAGLPLNGDPDTIVALWARSMWGTLTALALAVVFGAFLLGRWWASLLRAPGAFGSEYRRLRLGLTLGFGVTAVLVVAILTDSALVASLTWIACTALTFQGLAAAHRSKAGGRLNRGWLAAIYVLLVVPLSTSITVFVLVVWGFADNWLRPRAPQVKTS